MLLSGEKKILVYYYRILLVAAAKDESQYSKDNLQVLRFFEKRSKRFSANMKEKVSLKIVWPCSKAANEMQGSGHKI